MLTRPKRAPGKGSFLPGTRAGLASRVSLQPFRSSLLCGPPSHALLIPCPAGSLHALDWAGGTLGWWTLRQTPLGCP